MNVLGTTARHSAIYALGVALNRAAGFLMLPLYTRHLAPADYGVIEMLFMTTEVFAMIASAGLFSAVFRFHAEATDARGRRAVVATSTLMFVGFYAIAALLGACMAGPLAAHLLPGVEDGAHYFRLIFLSFFLQSFIEIPSLYLRVLGRPVAFVAVGAVKLVLQLSLNVLFLVALELRVLGVLYSTLLSSLAVGLVLLPWSMQRTGFAWDAVRARLLLAFGVPLIFASLGNFVLTFGERYFLARHAGLDEMGIYALGYKLGMALWVFAVAPLFYSWEAQRFTVATRPDATEIEARTFLWFNLGVIGCGLGLAVFAGDFFRLLSAPEFWGAREIVPLVVLAYLLQAWTQFTNFGLLHAGRTRHLAAATAVAAATMLLACAWLVPAHGAMGAAVATLIAFATRFALVWYSAQRSYRMVLPWVRVTGLLLLAVACWLLVELLRPSTSLGSIAAGSSGLLLFAVCTWYGGIVPRHDRAQLGLALRQQLRRIRPLKGAPGC